MTKLWSTTSLVALGLLGFLTWTNVEAQKKTYQQQHGQNHQSQGSATSHHPGHQKTPDTPEVSICDVSSGQRVPCGSQGISDEQCRALGCCHNGMECYFGKTVTVHCTRDGYFIVVVARCDTQPSIDIDSMRLLSQGDNCVAEASNSLFGVFRFPVTACGTLCSDEQGVIVYENMLTSMHRTQSGSGSFITRDSQYEVTVQCRYMARSTEYVNVQLGLQNPPSSIVQEGPIHVEIKLANGQCYQKGCTDESHYSSFYTYEDYPITKVLRDPVYVQVEVLNRNDPNAVLLLHRCWATTDAYPHSWPQWDILINGCPNIVDSDNIMLVPSDSNSYEHHKRFMFRMFTFLTSSVQKTTSTQQVYIHCSTSICLRTNGNPCLQLCNVPYKKTKRHIEEQGRRSVFSSDAVNFQDFPEA